jgi:hypothetical protein
MFSDSIIVTGDSPEEFVRSMCGVYMTLLNSSLLLRGGMVAGRLEFDPRQTRENFQKMLPQGDALARANALEKSVKGARFIVAPEIASQLVGSRREWLTLQGYIADPLLGADVPLQRSVAPVANGGGFEILYPVHERERADDATLSRDVEHLLYLVNASPPEVAVHYGETIAVIRHSQLRRTHMSRRVVP